MMDRITLDPGQFGAMWFGIGLLCGIIITRTVAWIVRP
jgi:hypothetical protein